MFTEKEIAYLESQPLARIGTSSTDQQVDVSPVIFEFDGQYFYVGGRIMEQTFKYKNVLAGNTKVSLTIDDMVSFDPWTPRGIKIHGAAELVEHEGKMRTGTFLRIAPTRSWSWGILEPAFQDGKWITSKLTW